MAIQYDNPLADRYASQDMVLIWSKVHRFKLWRKLWLELARQESNLGLPISKLQIDELENNVDNVDLDRISEYENKFKHDVMANIHAYGEQCPNARPIIHLGATSCFVTDNSDLILIKESLNLIKLRLKTLIKSLIQFADKYKSVKTVGLTHLQPAQPTTVGKRAAMWCYDYIFDLHEIENQLKTIMFRGVVGATGTMSSFLRLFGGDSSKIHDLNGKLANKFGFEGCYSTIGQTYPRGVDSKLLCALSNLAASCHKMATDIRLLAGRRELSESFGDEQIGSSAMPYKRNPMKCENVCGLSRFVINLSLNGFHTHAVQWMERTLDDSSNRRLSISQAFLAIDSILISCEKIIFGLVVNEEVIRTNLHKELPFLITENILMDATVNGGDRQDIHEVIRDCSLRAISDLNSGHPNYMLDYLNECFSDIDITAEMGNDSIIGMAESQVDEFINTYSYVVD